MAAQGYEFYLRVLKVSEANEWEMLSAREDPQAAMWCSVYSINTDEIPA